MASHLIQETGGLVLLEDGTGSILLEQQPIVTGNYLVQEADGTSRFELEDGSGFVLLEAAGPTPTPETATVGGIIIPRRRILMGKWQGRLEEDEAIALSLLLRTRKRLR